MSAFTEFLIISGWVGVIFLFTKINRKVEGKYLSGVISKGVQDAKGNTNLVEIPTGGGAYGSVGGFSGELSGGYSPRSRSRSPMSDEAENELIAKLQSMTPEEANEYLMVNQDLAIQLEEKDKARARSKLIMSKLHD